MEENTYALCVTSVEIRTKATIVESTSARQWVLSRQVVFVAHNRRRITYWLGVFALSLTAAKHS